jgi:signal transduction histidine kinase/ActR/RegA family two-component response regulator
MSFSLPPFPNDEAARLEELRACHLLDTSPEGEFDDLVRLAALICQAPASLISLIDESRQWFKSRQGIGVSETPRSVAFCSHTILQKDLMIVEDATQDSRFSSNPLVLSDPKIRFYAGAPLITASGHALGSLCVIDFVPRALTEDQYEALRLLSKQVVSQIERRRAKADLAVADAEKREARERLRQTAEREELACALLDKEKQLRRKTEEVNRAMDEFISLLSHELRTPLNAILGWAQVLSKKTLSETQLQQACGAIQRSARAQGRIIDDLLTLNRIVAGDVSLTREPLPLVDVVRTVVDSFAASATDKKITIVREGLELSNACVFGDRNRLQQIVGNLVSNAIRFSPAGSVIGVSVKVEGDAVQLIVSDDGIGIPADFLPHVFDRFRQADVSRTRRYGGMGIGLTIAKYLVELHGGTITAHSDGDEKGSQFTVAFPLWEEAHVAKQAPTVDHDGDALRGRRVLVVDDEPDSLELVLELLRGQGAEAVGAQSAADGLLVAEQIHPELIVSDIGMPITDGYGFIRELRAKADPSKERVPALALTAFSGDKERARAFAAGFDRHMSKPFDGKELLKSLGEMVQQA